MFNRLLAHTVQVSLLMLVGFTTLAVIATLLHAQLHRRRCRL